VVIISVVISDNR